MLLWKILDNGIVEDVNIVPMKLIEKDTQNKIYTYEKKIKNENRRKLWLYI